MGFKSVEYSGGLGGGETDPEADEARTVPTATPGMIRTARTVPTATPGMVRRRERRR